MEASSKTFASMVLRGASGPVVPSMSTQDWMNPDHAEEQQLVPNPSVRRPSTRSTVVFKMTMTPKYVPV